MARPFQQTRKRGVGSTERGILEAISKTGSASQPCISEAFVTGVSRQRIHNALLGLVGKGLLSFVWDTTQSARGERHIKMYSLTEEGERVVGEGLL